MFDYYNKLIDALIANNIVPFVTLYHWDLPQAVHDAGGWQSETVIAKFEEYARVCFEQFGDRVKLWLTFNEAWVITYMGYGSGENAPGVKSPGFAVYEVAHNIIRSHSRAYHAYNNDFKQKYGGEVGITLDLQWRGPLTDSLEDAVASDRAIQFRIGWFANAIFGGSGDYPQVMKEYIGKKSKRQGLAKSRLPEFTEDEKTLNKGAYDFFGINHYSTNLVYNYPQPDSEPDWGKDIEVEVKYDPCWPSVPGSSWMKVNPWGIRSTLRWLSEHYNNTPIYITENGRPDVEGLNDQDKIYYYKNYINEVLKAIRLDGVKVKGYTAWTVMDDLEWSAGYEPKFGLYHVDFASPNKTRTPRASANFYKQLIADHGFSKP